MGLLLRFWRVIKFISNANQLKDWGNAAREWMSGKTAPPATDRINVGAHEKGGEDSQEAPPLGSPTLLAWLRDQVLEHRRILGAFAAAGALYGTAEVTGLNKTLLGPVTVGGAARMERQIRAALETEMPGFTKIITPRVTLSGETAQITLLVNRAEAEAAMTQYVNAENARHSGFFSALTENTAVVMMQGAVEKSRMISAKVAQQAEYVPNVVVRVQYVPWWAARLTFRPRGEPFSGVFSSLDPRYHRL